MQHEAFSKGFYYFTFCLKSSLCCLYLIFFFCLSLSYNIQRISILAQNWIATALSTGTVYLYVCVWACVLYAQVNFYILFKHGTRNENQIRETKIEREFQPKKKTFVKQFQNNDIYQRTVEPGENIFWDMYSLCTRNTCAGSGKLEMWKVFSFILKISCILTYSHSLTHSLQSL